VVYQRNVCPVPAVLEPCFDVLTQRQALPLKKLVSKPCFGLIQQNVANGGLALDSGQDTSGVCLECSRSDFFFKHFDH